MTGPDYTAMCNLINTQTHTRERARNTHPYLPHLYRTYLNDLSLLNPFLPMSLPSEPARGCRYFPSSSASRGDGIPTSPSGRYFSHASANTCGCPSCVRGRLYCLCGKKNRRSQGGEERAGGVAVYRIGHVGRAGRSCFAVYFTFHGFSGRNSIFINL